MKRLIVLFIMLAAGLALWSQTVEEILKSKDVLAYTCEAGAFLMDVNTGKEIRIPVTGRTTKLIWNQAGTKLYRVKYYQDNLAFEDTLLLSEILLPSLQEKVLLSTPVDGYLTFNISVELGIDGNIYLYELIEEYDEYFDEYYEDWFVSYYYNPVSEQLEEMAEGSLSALTYAPSYLKTIVTEGDGIQNQLVEHPSNLLYELFITDNPKAENPVFRQLTHFDPKGKDMTLNGNLNEFQVSPDNKMIIFSYHYNNGNSLDNFAYTQVISRDGKKSQLISETLALKDMRSTWTPDSRLIFSKDVPANSNQVLLSIMDKNWKVKTLKTLNESKHPYIYYRAQE